MKTEADIIIKNAKQIITECNHNLQPATGPEMEAIGLLEQASVAIIDGKIAAVNDSDTLTSEYSAKIIIDATGKVVTPGLIDPHTHFVFAGSRENELEMKIKGADYLTILKSGGGILRTVNDTRAATKDQLLQICRERGENLLLHGTTTIEAKSGYGLNLQDEIKSLEVIRELNEQGPLTYVPTFLGAHAIPQEYQGKTSDYVELLCESIIPDVAGRKLASYCDVFCEKGVFEIEDSRRILETGRDLGLKSRIHADELYPLGGAELAAEVNAVSADHLLYSSERGLSEMRKAGVIATLLPAAPLTLMMEKFADARKMISLGVAVALGSDLSPSCWLENQQLVIALACYKLRMTPAEALTACTINAAHSIQMADKIGSIEVGKRADIAIFNIGDYRFLGYRMGANMIDTVIKSGQILVENGVRLR